MTDKTDTSKEREAFEAWYCDQMRAVGYNADDGIANLRESNHYGKDRVMLNGKWEGWQARASLAASAGSEPVALPFAILADEMAALRRFDECVRDDGSYDISKEMMKRLAEIGLVRRVTGNVYEHTTFGLSVLSGDFSTHPSPPDGMVGGWMPIETAPGDMGAYLFLCGGVAVEGFIDATGTYCVRQEAGSGWRKMWRKPTHWMPLPPPPTMSADSGKGD